VIFLKEITILIGREDFRFNPTLKTPADARDVSVSIEFEYLALPSSDEHLGASSEFEPSRPAYAWQSIHG
jgi:hypothetical protein